MTDETIFATALEKASPAERTAFLTEICGVDSERRKHLERLLAAHAGASEFLERPAVAVPAVAAETRTAGLVAGAPTDDEEVPLTFLQPSTRPGSLGRLGRYEALQVLGKGGFGIVFRAHDEVLQRVVALKVLAPALASTSPARKRFLREARSSAQVRHDNVVQVYEVVEQPVPYLVMEFIPGETLQQRLDRVGPLEVPEILRLGRQIAEGLAAAHATNLIHRDIKPGNLLLEGGRQRVKITDFGLARAADDASMSRSGVLAGTPMYMAPEQVNGEPLDHRADLFSLGSVLYQMTSGRPPFRATSTLAVLRRVAEDAPRPIRELIPETPQWLCEIIAKLHAKNPDERFQSAREVADVLADCEAQLKANSKLKDFSRIPQSKQRAAGKSRRWPWAAAALFLPVLALAGTEIAGLTHLFRGQQAPTNSVKPGNDPAPVFVQKKEAPVPDAKAKSLPLTFTNSIGMEFVIVPKGKSWLGGDNGKLGDKELVIPADFYLGKFEVTQEEWEKVMGENPSHFSRTGSGKDAVKDIPDADLRRFPVENVSWDQCQVFVAKLNTLAKETGWVYRLPTPAEWEYACRGGPLTDKADSAFDFYFAKPTNTFSPQANFLPGSSNRTRKVGSYEPNRLGLFDMHGNLWEVCDDNEKPGASHAQGRGGSFRNSPETVPTAQRDELRYGAPDWARGLRLARVPAGAPSPELKMPIDPERRAAEYVLSIGGKVMVNEQAKELQAAADLPPEPFRLTGIRLHDNKQVTDASLVVFKDCKNLRHLSLTGASRVSDAGMVHFKDASDLIVLVLNRTMVGNAGLAHFKDCKKLEQLALSFTAANDGALAPYKDCQNLKSVTLNGTKIGDADLAVLERCKNLNHLDLFQTPITDAGLAHVKDVQGGLFLHKTNVSDAGLVHLKECKNLQNLNVRGTKITPAALEALRKALPNCLIQGDDGGVIVPR